jgi:hypothetical protein
LRLDGQADHFFLGVTHMTDPASLVEQAWEQYVRAAANLVTAVRRMIDTNTVPAPHNGAKSFEHAAAYLKWILDLPCDEEEDIDVAAADRLVDALRSLLIGRRMHVPELKAYWHARDDWNVTPRE